MHGWEPTYMVGALRGRPWPPKAGRLAGQATRYVGSPPCMWVPNHAFGFPTMYFDQRYQVSGIRYQVSGIRYQLLGIRYQVQCYALRIACFTHCLLHALPLYALPALRLKLEVEGVWNSPAKRSHFQAFCMSFFHLCMSM